MQIEMLKLTHEMELLQISNDLSVQPDLLELQATRETD
jgi:hypothetical protein